MILLFIGAPGSGKDTQAEFVARDYGYEIVSTGQLFRDEVAKSSELGRKLDAIMSAGQLVEDALVYEILGNHLRECPNQNVILTGVVRTLPQVQMLADTLTSINRQLDKVVYIEIPPAEVTSRLLDRKRPDDTPEAIQKRINDFQPTISEILPAYEQQGLLVRVDGLGTREEVYTRVKTALKLN